MRARPSWRVGASTLLAAFCCALGAAGISASAALAADAVYWGDQNGTVNVGALNGSGSPASLFTGEGLVRGVGIDLAANKLYWSMFGGNTIRAGNLDGSGSASSLYTGENGPYGIAVDPAVGKIYWADFAGGTIRVANLNGTGSPATLFSGESTPSALALDPAGGKIYWTDDTGLIRVGNLNGSGTATTLFSGESHPRGIAIDPAAGKVYWTTWVASGAVRVGNLSGSGTASDLFAGEANPFGVAVDPSAGKIYWAEYGSGPIRVGNLNGSGTASSLFTGNAPTYVALLRSPLAAGAPLITGGSNVGTRLTCSQGSWAPDLLGAFLYRAPVSFAYQWSSGGSEISGETSNTYTPSTPGSYTCRVTATNQAGSASQTSAQRQVLVAPPTPTITKAKIKSSKHSAKFTFKATGAPGFQCALVKKPKKHHKAAQPHFKSCTSPKTYKHLKHGKYTFDVRAVSGAIAGTPATKSFKIA